MFYKIKKMNLLSLLQSSNKIFANIEAINHDALLNRKKEIQ